MLFYGPVAFTCLCFKALRVQYLDFSPVMTDEAEFFEPSDRNNGTHPANADHSGQRLLRERESPATRPFKAKH